MEDTTQQVLVQEQMMTVDILVQHRQETDITHQDQVQQVEMADILGYLQVIGNLLRELEHLQAEMTDTEAQTQSTIDIILRDLVQQT